MHRSRTVLLSRFRTLEAFTGVRAGEASAEVWPGHRARCNQAGVLGDSRREGSHFASDLTSSFFHVGLAFHLVLFKPFEDAAAELLFELMAFPERLAALTHIGLAAEVLGVFFDSLDFEAVESL